MTRPLLVVMALELESQGRFEAAGVDVLFTGLGKVNACHSLTRRLVELRSRGEAPLVVNFGTAGSPRHPTGALLACRRFVQRDMDVTGLGFALGQTPFENHPAELSFAPVFTGLAEAVCATGDRFETLGGAVAYEVIDMEGYALAKVCLKEGLDFCCAKYISDGADHAAGQTWQESLPLAASAFLGLYHSLLARAPI